MRRNISSLFLNYAKLDRKRTTEGLLGLEEQIRATLEHELTQKFSPDLPQGASRRSSIRVATDLRCTFGALPLARDASIKDLSRSGVFIRTDAPLAVGSELWIRIPVPGRGTVEVAGVVAAHVGDEGSALRGMGVRFAPMGPDAMEAVDALYQSSIVQRFGVPTGGDGSHWGLD